MSLQIADYGSDSSDKVQNDLTKIFSPALTVDPATGSVSLNDSWSMGSLDGDYVLHRLAKCSALITMSLVEQLPTTPRSGWTLYVEPEPAWGQLEEGGKGWEQGNVEISYMDAGPFWVELASNDTRYGQEIVQQAEAREIILLHMLSHAYDLLDGWPPSKWDLMDGRALDRENEWRAEHDLRRRLSTKVLPPPPSQRPRYDLGGCGCFIATAAYGSAFEPEVASLRRFRDDILLRTRTGAAFFERFYRHYYRFSPGIAAAIERDAELREAARWAATPVVRYLEIAQMLPDAPLEGVPEPWRGFLTDMRDKLEAWGTTLGLPDDFRGLSPVAAAAELAMALRYILRSEESRQRYLERLAALGQIPIACGAHEYEACARALTAAGRPEPELSRLLTIAREEVAP